MSITRIYQFLSGTVLPETVQLASVTERNDDRPPSYNQNTRHYLRFHWQATSFTNYQFIHITSFTQSLTHSDAKIGMVDIVTFGHSLLIVRMASTIR